MPEFDVLIEGLDAITLGDVYKAAFPNGILRSISEQYLRSPALEDDNAVIMKPDNFEVVKSTATDNGEAETDIAGDNDIQYDEVTEDDSPPHNDEDLKEVPITDDYVYDQPVEDRLFRDQEYVTTTIDDIENDDTGGSKNINYALKTDAVDEEHRNKEISKYGARFRNWITKFLAG